MLGLNSTWCAMSRAGRKAPHYLSIGMNSGRHSGKHDARGFSLTQGRPCFGTCESLLSRKASPSSVYGVGLCAPIRLQVKCLTGLVKPVYSSSENGENVAEAETSSGTRAGRLGWKNRMRPSWKGVLFLLTGLYVGNLYLENRLRALFANALNGYWDEDWDESWRPDYEKLDKNSSVLRKINLGATGTDATARSADFSSTRQLLLVRHGQYHNVKDTDDDRQGLTALGREQAHYAGRRLAETLKGKKIRAIYHSDMKRAVQTAKIIARYLPGVLLVQDPLLAEGVPAFPDPPSATFQPTDVEVELGEARIEAAFRKYFFRPPSPEVPPAYSGEYDVYDILVCHGNVIRYMFCRALQFPRTAWLRLATYNCGMTWMTIDNRGFVSAREFGNVGFIPMDKVTYS